MRASVHSRQLHVLSKNGKNVHVSVSLCLGIVNAVAPLTATSERLLARECYYKPIENALALTILLDFQDTTNNMRHNSYSRKIRYFTCSSGHVS